MVIAVVTSDLTGNVSGIVLQNSPGGSTCSGALGEFCCVWQYLFDIDLLTEIFCNHMLIN